MRKMAVGGCSMSVPTANFWVASSRSPLVCCCPTPVALALLQARSALQQHNRAASAHSSLRRRPGRLRAPRRAGKLPPLRERLRPTDRPTPCSIRRRTPACPRPSSAAISLVSAARSTNLLCAFTRRRKITSSSSFIGIHPRTLQPRCKTVCNRVEFLAVHRSVLRSAHREVLIVARWVIPEDLAERRNLQRRLPSPLPSNRIAPDFSGIVSCGQLTQCVGCVGAACCGAGVGIASVFAVG